MCVVFTQGLLFGTELFQSFQIPERISGRLLELCVRFHAERLEALALRQQVVEALHQRYGLVDAHLNPPQDHGHLVHLLDLFSVFGVAFLPVLHDTEERLH